MHTYPGFVDIVFSLDCEMLKDRPSVSFHSSFSLQPQAAGRVLLAALQKEAERDVAHGQQDQVL